jgi:tetratricopeptide (TPR) repeat protein
MSARRALPRCCALLLVALGASACAPTLPRSYQEARAAGHRAYSAGRYDEAARMYRDAARASSRVHDRDEMLFLEAAAHQRAGRHREARARYEALLAASPTGGRASRAAHEVAELEIAHGDEERGYALLEAAFLRFPTSGPSRHALTRYLKHLDETRGVEAALAYLQARLALLEHKGLGEAARYQMADRLERLGRAAEARDAFVQCARAYPYPHGGLYDDSLMRASLLDEKLGDPRLAIERLREMLGVREPSLMSGSYERTKFSAAQMRIAVLLRDALHDHAAARRELRALFTDHRSSILRDDALWAEARLAAQDGDRSGACEAASLLVRELPDSRFAACASLLCESVPALPKPRPCHDYIRRDLASPRAPGAP